MIAKNDTAVGAGSREHASLYHEQEAERVNWEQHPALKPQIYPPVTHFHPQGHTAQAFPNSTTGGRGGVCVRKCSDAQDVGNLSFKPLWPSLAHEKTRAVSPPCSFSLNNCTGQPSLAPH